MTREQAVRLLKGKAYVFYGEMQLKALGMAIEALEQEPKRGHWTNEAGEPNDEQYSLYCSECKAWSEYRDRYCPNCGARMELKK